MAERNSQVEKELSQLVNAVTKVLPSTCEIRVFGSYENGGWNPNKSDIDVYVEVTDEDLSYFKNQQVFDYSSQESKLREGLRNRIMNQLTGDYKDRFSMHILTRGDLKTFWNWDEGRGPIGRNIKRTGRVLYIRGVGSEEAA